MREEELHLRAEDLWRLAGSPCLPERALLVGPRARLAQALEMVSGTSKVLDLFEYEMHRGRYGGVEVLVGLGGRYAPEAAIVAELLAVGGVRLAIRAGSCGSLTEALPVGSLLLVEGALREEGTTAAYVPPGFPALSAPELVLALESAARRRGRAPRRALVWTTDALLRERRDRAAPLRQLGVEGVDMATAAFLVASRLRGVRAAALLAVSDVVPTGQVGFLDPRFQEAEREALRICLEALSRA